MIMLDDDIERCINSLGEKFLKWPYNFFTESDAHSFLYYYIFRSKYKPLKLFYSTKDSQDKTVLLHREYPTSFRFRRDSMKIDDTGGRGHYDLVILNPDFIANHSIDEVIAKEFKKCRTGEKYHLLSAIEFKLVVNPLSKGMKSEIEKDFLKLSLAKDLGQAMSVYMVIFNRYREEIPYINELNELASQNPHVKGLYIASIKSKPRHYRILYLNQWEHKLRFEEGDSFV